MATSVDLKNLISSFFRLKGLTFDFADPIHKELFKRYSRDATAILRMAGNDYKKARDKIAETQQWAKSRELDWSLQTVVKRWLEDNSPKRTPYFNWSGTLYPMSKRYDTWMVRRDGEWKEFTGDERDIVWQ